VKAILYAVMVYLFYMQGMWTGMMSGTVVQTLILAIITMRYDWEKEVCFTKRSVLARNGTVLVSFSSNKIKLYNALGLVLFFT